MGKRLAEGVSQAGVEGIPEPTTNDITQFQSELADFADSWLDRGFTDPVKSAVTLISNAETCDAWTECLGRQQDIGVEEWGRIEPQYIHSFIGLMGALPIAFRHHTCGEGRQAPADSDGLRPFPGSSPVVISWHQLVYAGAVFRRLTQTDLAPIVDRNYSAAPQELFWFREMWTAVPGVGLLDEMGLGKSICAMTLIGSLQNCYYLERECPNQLPDCIKEKILGCRKGVPNAGHLIIVPGTLLGQWLMELRRFFRPSFVDIIVVSGEQTKWGGDMRRIRSSDMPAWRRVVLITHNVSSCFLERHKES